MTGRGGFKLLNDLFWSLLQFCHRFAACNIIWLELTPEQIWLLHFTCHVDVLLKLEGYLSVPTLLQNHHLTPLQSLL